MSKMDDLASLELIVKPLLEAANTEHWRGSLNVLYLSGHVMAFSEELQLPCIISGRGPFDDIELSADLLKGKYEVTLSKLGKGIIPIILPRLISFFNQPEVKEAIEHEEDGEFLSLWMGVFSDEMSNIQDELYQLLIQGTSSISDWIVIELYNSLIETREKMIRSAFYDAEYEDMVDSLIKIKLIEPRFQISICPQCANYHIMLSKTPTLLEDCPSCGEEWASITLFTFISSYEEIKKNNSDLPLFISSYLKHKIISLNPKKELEIIPMKKLQVEDVVFDVDVYIPKYHVGFECKVFEDAFARMTGPRLNSIVADVFKQIKRYYDADIHKVILVTNLVESSTGKLEKSLKKKMLENGYPDNIEILHKDVDFLLGWLDEKAQKVTDQLAEDFVKSLGLDNQKQQED